MQQSNMIISLERYQLSLSLYIGEPFYSSGPFDLSSNNVTSVIVRAINCNGQRVEVCMDITK